MSPRVSVVLGVKDDRGGLRATIDSVLAQEAGELELIAVDDGSRDATPALLAEDARSDSRVRVLTNPVNQGLTASLNEGLRAAEGEWIARIDEGDTWAIEKLRLQLERVGAEPELALLGTQVEFLEPDTGAPYAAQPWVPTTDAAIRQSLLRCNNPFFHSSVLFRRGLLYTEGPGLPERAMDTISDLELWLRLSFLGLLANLDARLVGFSYGAGHVGLTTERASLQFDLKARLHARFVQLIESGDPVAARHVVDHGFPVELEGLPPAPGFFRRLSFRLRYAGGHARPPLRQALKGLGYLLDPPSIPLHLRNKLLTPNLIRTHDWRL